MGGDKKSIVSRLLELYDRHHIEEVLNLDYDLFVQKTIKRKKEHEGHLLRSYLKERSKLKSFMDQGIISEQEFLEQDKQLMTMYNIKDAREGKIDKKGK